MATHRPQSSSRRVRLLDAVPDLASGLTPEGYEAARRQAVAPVVELDCDIWDPPDLVGRQQPGYLGMLVIDGLLTRDAAIAETVATELIGPGDFLRPGGWEHFASALSENVAWTVVEPTRLALLDHRFAATAASWPSVMSALLERAVARSKSLAFNLTIGHMTGIDTRLLALFWHLAERFGWVGPEGVVVPLALTHELLGRLIGARRPSVTSALRQLEQKAMLRRRQPRGWILLADPPMQLSQPRTS